MAALSGVHVGRSFLILSALIPAFGFSAIAQSQQPESLGDVARQFRAERAKERRKAPKVFTNDNLPKPVAGEPVTTMESAAASSLTSPQDESTAATHPSGEESNNKVPIPANAKTRTRDYWQARFRAARLEVANAKRQEQVSEDELNLLTIQRVREMDPIVKDDLTNKTEAKQSEVDLNKAALAAGQKALSELENEFKDSGASGDWSETE